MGKNNNQSNRQNEKKGQSSGQPEPLSGSHKVKNRNHSRQKIMHIMICKAKVFTHTVSFT